MAVLTDEEIRKAIAIYLSTDQSLWDITRSFSVSYRQFKESIDDKEKLKDLYKYPTNYINGIEKDNDTDYGEKIIFLHVSTASYKALF